MKKKMTTCALLVLASMASMAQTRSESPRNEEGAYALRRYELTYGAWDGETTEHLPTKVRTYYYGEGGRLLCALDACYQLGDSETTVEVEVAGELKPETYTSYTYDAEGRLQEVSEKRYKAVNGYYYGWGEAQVSERNTYDDAGHCVLKSSRLDGEFTYVWSGDTLKQETNISARGTWNYTNVYSDFVEGSTDCPCYVFQTGKYQNYIIENTYDEQLRKTCSVTYQIADRVTDEEGRVIGGVKGDAYRQETWTYEGDLMTEYVCAYWNKSKQTFVPSTKQTYVQDETEGGIVETTYSYSLEKWHVFGSSKAYIDATYSADALVTGLTLEDVSSETGRVNTLRVAFDVPKTMGGEVKWGVYRNGCFMGYAVAQKGQQVFYDYEVANGSWDYFVKADTLVAGADFLVSERASYTFDTVLPAVDGITCVESGLTTVDGNPAYAYSLVWDAPQTNYPLLGYLVYLNPKDDGTSAPHNREMVSEPRYRLWETSFDNDVNTIVVEAVYKVGSVKSAPVQLTLDKDHVMSAGGTVNKRVTRVYGDVMGGVDSDQPQKQHYYFYDSDNLLLRSIEMGALTGDDPDTEEVEVAGTEVPIAYNVYEYDYLGNLLAVKRRTYGMYSGYDMAWNDEFVVNEMYVYDEMTGKLIERVEAGKKYTYKWSGERKTVECCYAASGVWLSQITYSLFNKFNQPQYALSVSKNENMTSYNRVYEFEYDEMGNMTAKREYKWGDNVETDDSGEVIGVDKGRLHVEEIWTYEVERIVSYQQNRYSSSKQQMMPYSKREYVVTTGGVRETSYSYNASNEAWVKSGVVTEEGTAEYYSKSHPKQLKLTDVEDVANTVRLSWEAPERLYADNPVYEVYRNGVKIGEATANEAGRVEYVDSLVQNGVWDYFVKVAPAYGGVDYYVSSVVEKEFNTPLTPVAEISFPVNGRAVTGELQLEVAWAAPETDMDVVGYNIYTDIKEMTKNPSPDNGLYPIAPDRCSYTYVWSSLLSLEKTVCVEVVYPIGKVKSAQVPVTIQTTPMGIEEVSADEYMTVDGATIRTANGVTLLALYDMKGRVVGKGLTSTSVGIGHLASGVYVLQLQTASGIVAHKFVKR